MLLSHVLLPRAVLSSPPVFAKLHSTSAAASASRRPEESSGQTPPPGSSAASRTARICGGARLFGLGVVCAFTKASNTRAVLLLRLVTQTLADWLSVTATGPDAWKSEACMVVTAGRREATKVAAS